MKRNIRVLSILMVIAVLVGMFSVFPTAKTTAKNNYPFVMIHGLNAFGEDPGWPLQYWGLFNGTRTLPYLRELGYEVYAPGTNPFGSCWDRSCELYARLTGTRVDYGEAHSKAHGHDRYGTTFTEPLFSGWSKTKKIHLLGSSFGGNVALYFSNLLQVGSKEEQKASPKDCSPLFKGGKGNWVKSVTTLAAPLQGTTFLDIVDLDGFFYFYGAVNAPFAWSNDAMCGNTPWPIVTKTLAGGIDNGYYECTVAGAKTIDYGKPQSNVYYLSYSYDATKQNPVSQLVHTADPEVASILQMATDWIGHYIFPDSDLDSYLWQPNDGLVNTVSAQAPVGAPVHYTKEVVKFKSMNPGVWNVTPARLGNHATHIGLLLSEEELQDFYKTLFEGLSVLR
ncbi:MAG: hypothetical protein LBR73_03905 [Oscillospiraceae bacterium]|nr:hypothetical protein [Oscillospiraceae bacterium]